MNIAKTIKQQALQYLAKDNWATAIGGFFIICLPAILIVLFQGVALCTMQLFWDLDNLTMAQNNIILILQLVLVFAFLLTTPMITGYLKLCYNISKGNNANLSDVFYYYRNKCFGKCFLLNLKIIVRIILHFLLVMIPALFALELYFLSHTQNIQFLILALLFFSGAVIETVFYSVKYTLIPIIMFEDESLNTKEVFYLGTTFMKDKLKVTRTLLFTFLPHILLCFFVVPWIFIFPYITVSFMTNSKWISELHKNNTEV
ncbi:MAG: hypothetical protein J1F17_01080 [Oscillospiraceae bacterium]|nr:hypothetical protein [Oscillospiraceae bacterium]